MSKRYILLAALLILAGIGLVILPEKPDKNELEPPGLLQAIDDPSRFLSTDLITERIIRKDPSLMLIDVRTPLQVSSFTLPGAINIPLDSLAAESSVNSLNQDYRDKVFISNDDIWADQAWQICKRMKCENIYVMKGGINLWFSTIMNDIPPQPIDDTRVTELYSFRKAARQFFRGDDLQTESRVPAKKNKDKVKVIKQSAPKASSGGC